MNPKLLLEQQGYAFVPAFCPDLEPAAAAEGGLEYRQQNGEPVVFARR